MRRNSKDLQTDTHHAQASHGRNSKGLQVDTHHAQTTYGRRTHTPHPSLAQVLADADKSKHGMKSGDIKILDAVVRPEGDQQHVEASTSGSKDTKARPKAMRRNASYGTAHATETSGEASFPRAKSAEPPPPGCPTPSVLSPGLESFPAYHEMGSPTPGTPPDAPYCILDLYRDSVAVEGADSMTKRNSCPNLKPVGSDPATVDSTGPKRRTNSTTSSKRQESSREKSPSRLVVWLCSLWCM